MSGAIYTDLVIIVITDVDNNPSLGPLLESFAGFVLVLDLNMLTKLKFVQLFGPSRQVHCFVHDSCRICSLSLFCCLAPLLSGHELVRLER